MAILCSCCCCRCCSLHFLNIFHFGKMWIQLLLRSSTWKLHCLWGCKLLISWICVARISLSLILRVSIFLFCCVFFFFNSCFGRVLYGICDFISKHTVYAPHSFQNNATLNCLRHILYIFVSLHFTLFDFAWHELNILRKIKYFKCKVYMCVLDKPFIIFYALRTILKVRTCAMCISI